MVSVYSDADYLAIYKQRRRARIFYGSLLTAYLVFCISLWIYYMSLPYKDPNQGWPKMSVYVVSAIFMVFSCIFLGIKYSRIRRYYRMISYVSTGLKNEETNHFYCFEEKSLQKDNIDVVAAVFETWNKKKKEWMEREVYCDPEKPMPPFEEGDHVRYITQSNFIIQYEILQKRALEFEEVDDDEEILRISE